MPAFTTSIVGLTIYLFAIHSYKLLGFQLASIGLAVGLLGALASGRELVFSRPVIWMGAWLLWCTGGLAISSEPATVAKWLPDFAKLLVVMFIASNAMRSRREVLLLSLVWLALFVLYPMRGTYFNYVFGLATAGRYGWNFAFANFNDLAAYSLLLLGIAGFLALSELPRLWRLGLLGVTGCLAVLVVITQSRGGFVAMVVATILYGVRSTRRTQVFKTLAGLALVVVLASPKAVWERFARMKFLTSSETISQVDSSAEQRALILQVARAIITDHPLQGVGLGAYNVMHARYAAERQEWAFARGEKDTHNLYLNVWAETGLIGLVLFLSIPGSVLLAARRVERRIRSLAGAGAAADAERLRVLRFGLVAFLLAAVFGSLHRIGFIYLYVAILTSATVHLDPLLNARRV